MLSRLKQLACSSGRCGSGEGRLKDEMPDKPNVHTSASFWRCFSSLAASSAACSMRLFCFSHCATLSDPNSMARSRQLRHSSCCSRENTRQDNATQPKDAGHAMVERHEEKGERKKTRFQHCVAKTQDGHEKGGVCGRWPIAPCEAFIKSERHSLAGRQQMLAINELDTEHHVPETSKRTFLGYMVRREDSDHNLRHHIAAPPHRRFNRLMCRMCETPH